MSHHDMVHHVTRTITPVEQAWIKEFRAAMAKREVSIAEVARRSGLARERISRILNAKEFGSTTTWDRMWKAVISP